MNDILVGGQWRPANSTGSINAVDPRSGQAIEGDFPISNWDDCAAAIEAAAQTVPALEAAKPAQIAKFLRTYADNLDANSEAICAAAEKESGLPMPTRLQKVEMPRATRQLRLAADAAENEVWRNPVVDAEINLASCRGPIGPVFVIGPNNFPLAFNAIAGSDFASAIAAGNPVIAKAHPSHPLTTKLMAEQAVAALAAAELPAATVQMLYHMSPEDGLRMVKSREIAAVGFTGSRNAGVALKAAADECGKPIYLEMSSVNPVFFLPSLFEQRPIDEVIAELSGSCLLAAGQFCTCPNLFVLLDNEQGQQVVEGVKGKFEEQTPTVLLSGAVLGGLESTAALLQDKGAQLLAGGKPSDEEGIRFQNTLFKVTGDEFLANTETMQTEGFGPLSLAVLAKDMDQFYAIADSIEGSLTGSVYGSASDPAAQELVSRLRRRVGRIIQNKMPTGVAVSPAMNHGGPFPATGHPGFTAVGMPTSIGRFTKLDCYDNLEDALKPDCLK